jgi:uncharacterized peroxidase-related enzyme
MMPFFPSHPADATPATVFTARPELYEPWSRMSEALMNGPSPFTPGEREMIAAFVVGVAGCQFALVAHRAAAEAWGISKGLVDQLVDDLAHAPIEPKFKPLLGYVRKLTLTPGEMDQVDADAVFAAGWDEAALHDAIAITARMCFMQRLVEGHGFTPMSPEVAAKNARERVERGYLHLYPEFAQSDD